VGLYFYAFCTGYRVNSCTQQTTAMVYVGESFCAEQENSPKMKRRRAVVSHWSVVYKV